MLKKISYIATTAASLAVLAYIAITIVTVVQSDPGTVLTMNVSQQSPPTARMIAQLRVRAWDECPLVNSDISSVGQTLRGYGLEGFDNQRVLQAASLLIELGCDVNERSKSGQAPLHEAILYNEAEVVRYLLANGADPTIAIMAPSAARSAALQHYDGMNAMQFARELDARDKPAAARAEILKMLQRHAS